MSKIMWKNLCFPNFIKCLPTIQAPPDQPSNKNSPSSPSTTTCTSLLIKNFNTLYDFNLINSSSSSSSADDVHTSSSDSDSDLSPPDFATIFASQRFFFSSPGRSNSITESPHTTTTKPNKPPHKTTLVTKGVRVRKFSSNPYFDFRRSMEEMLEANRDHHMLVGHDHHHHSTSDDVEYLHELLLCYLSLNPKHAHKDIISAFTDLVICLLSANSSAPASAADDRRENPKTH
ncbi:hypothetical protein PRUPE_1G014600 [Prunus persica]|uniref:Transcription repressor n=1 Tax=Prunus persica TaxID=3760 RepID=M5Y1H5_PRUPE|nr:transcription repressor OFP12 [Prunus persica]ONI26278.1 hypothetical protein PRUPE_1G014600 [Prunus persica]